MKDLFRVVLVGRPNVGKSSLFNALLGYRRSIVLNMDGTTRDEVAETVDWGTGKFLLVDCFGASEESNVQKLEKVLEKASAVLFVVDGKSGLNPMDRELALHVKQKGVPTLVCVNKTDSNQAEGYSAFCELPFHEVVETSAAHHRGLTELRAWIQSRAGSTVENSDREKDGAPRSIRVALIGRPNAGKSTLMNRLCGEKISMVSPEALTTRDPIAFEQTTPQGVIRWVDTAGIRRPRSEKSQVEVFSIQASTREIGEADVVFLMVDASGNVSDQDVRLLSLIERQGKPAAVLLNFWDKFKEKDRRSFWENSEFLPLLKRFPTLTISGRTGFNADRLIPLAWEMAEAASGRVPTAKLNRLVESIVSRNPPPSFGKGNFNILYASQVKSSPPTFVLFVNRKQSLPGSYERYLSETLRKSLDLKGQALRIYFREARGRS